VFDNIPAKLVDQVRYLSGGVRCGVAVLQANSLGQSFSPFDYDGPSQFFKGSQYRGELIVTPFGKNSTSNTPSLSQKTVAMTLPAERVTLNFLGLGEVEWQHSFDCCFVSGMKWCAHDSSPVTMES